MPAAAKKETDKKQKLKPQLVSKRKVTNCLSKDKGHVRLKKNKIVEKAISHKRKTYKKEVLKDKNDKTSVHSEKSNEKDVKSPKLKRKRKKTRKNNAEIDEASRLQRRTRYMFIKMKLEQNFIDAYSTEGWKGQSREKIKPEKELERAKKQILNCKLGIREAIRQLDLLSSVGSINDSAVAPDGSVHHEHIFCAKCKLRDAYPDNDIILCDGTCNCAFHQMCLDPPLLTENIPPGDEGWLCKFCKEKIEILEATNAHLGTQIPLDSDWKDVFKEEAEIPDGENSMLRQEELWPSDESDDDDYDPVQHISRESLSLSESDASNCSFSSQVSLEDEMLLGHGRIEQRSGGSFSNSLEMIGVDSDEFNAEVVSRPRQRSSVDYIKLYDEMFGKNATENEKISDDEDWGPTKWKRKVKVTETPSAPVPVDETEMNSLEEPSLEIKKKVTSEKTKRLIFRLPHNAVEKLRLAFAENELPSRSLRKNLSEQLGLEYEKVNKWFKNARYLALKSRKAEGANTSGNVSPSVQKESTSKTEKGEIAEQTASMDNTTSEFDKNSSKYVRKRKIDLPPNSVNIKQQKKLSVQTPDSIKTIVDVGDDVSLKHLQEKAKAAAKNKKKKLNTENNSPVTIEAEAEMERLCQIKNCVEKLGEVLLKLPISRFGKINKNNSSVVYVPVVELKEKG